VIHFAYSLPWWLAALLAAGAGTLAFLEYRRPLSPIARGQRMALVTLRTLALLALIIFLFRPIVLLPPAGGPTALVPVLVDVSRSMRLVDADGQPRIARAQALLRTKILPALSKKFITELYGVGQGLGSAKLEALVADAPSTNVSAALAAVRERYRGQRVAAIVLISDGGDTELDSADAAREGSGPPVFAVGVGSPDGLKDREVVGITAGDQRLDQASVDLDITAVSFGFGRVPFQLRLSGNGTAIDSRRVVPPADGSPVHEVFTVSPDPLSPTVYTAEISRDEGEGVPENNARQVLVSPAGRKRRLLIIEGAPGFEHSFVQRAWTRDPGLEVDAVVRKGKNAEAQDTFFVQAGAGRAAALTTGFPARREDLYAYDALVIANVEGEFFSRAQLQTAADFVAERGGGLLVLGGRSFGEHGLAGTALEAVLPVELNARQAIVRASFEAPDVPHNKLVLTTEGQSHPVMRIGSSAEETRKIWAALPPLAASAPLGGPRPGATLLAVTEAPGGRVYPVVAAQRYGRGLSLVFAGEASWRWKMMMAATDRSYEFFWRQAARWLVSAAPDAVAITLPDAPQPGDSIAIDVDARDAAFAPVADASVEVTLTVPGGAGASTATKTLPVRRADGARGRFSAAVRVEQPGLYRVHAEARRGRTPLGAADRWMLVGGIDREFTSPRLNEAFLRRVARGSGGRYVRAADVAQIVPWLESAVPQNAAPEQRDLWHEPWAFAIIVVLLSGEWILRRRWGLR
jgi:hypothetical protein